jgi:biopolymer transport protein ExbD
MNEINIIPLVDVTLVLLIIFMATTAFVNDAGLNMKLPGAKTEEAPPPNNRDMNVALTKNGGLYLDGKIISPGKLQVALQQRGHANPETTVVINGDENIAYKRVVEIMDEAKQANLAKVVLSTQPESELTSAH